MGLFLIFAYISIYSFTFNSLYFSFPLFSFFILLFRFSSFTVPFFRIALRHAITMVGTYYNN
jgi:hypothetical protein